MEEEACAHGNEKRSDGALRFSFHSPTAAASKRDLFFELGITRRPHSRIPVLRSWIPEDRSHEDPVQPSRP